VDPVIKNARRGEFARRRDRPNLNDATEGESEMKTMVLLIACAALAACNKSPEIHEKNASIEQVAEAAGKANAGAGIVLRAGQWRLTGTMEDISFPGMPASAQADVKRMMGEKNSFTTEYCLTPEEAKRPRGKFFGGKQSDNCRYETFDMEGGKIDAVMRCEGQPSGSMTMKISGTYAPDSYSTTAAMEASGEGRGGMSMKMHSEARRIGDCDAAAAEKKS
jgi:hypothetical protein